MAKALEDLREDILSNTIITEAVGTSTEAEGAEAEEAASIREEAQTWAKGDNHIPTKGKTMVSKHLSKGTTKCNSNHPSAE
ncbi:MAG: hypothetical protein ACMG6E_06255 [Candidatus Roizmanbacteria bacterium]